MGLPRRFERRLAISPRPADRTGASLRRSRSAAADALAFSREHARSRLIGEGANILRLTRIVTLCALAALIAALPPAIARADYPDGEARELTAQCSFAADGAHEPFSRLTDGEYRHPFSSKDGALVIRAPEGTAIATLYLCFAGEAETFALQREKGGAWETFVQESPDYAHATVSVPALSAVRIAATGGKALALNELRVFSQGELPEDVQQWRPIPQKADLMLVVAHPDDEFLFFGGLIPWYAAQGRRVLVVYMTCQDTTRRAELLNGLWTAGLREYPVIGGFLDRSTRTLEAMYDAWTREEVDSFLIKLIRVHQPDVLVTHAVNGEYGHGAHRVCADAALRVFDKTSDPMYLPQHSKAYGVWQVKKLYLHLYGQNSLRMDWARDAGGTTALELARRGFEMHVSQRHFHLQDGEAARYDSAAFGLAKSVVGPDAAKDDFFENLP